MDRNKRRWLIGGTSVSVLAGLVFYASAEPEERPKQRERSVEEERIEGLVDLMSTNSMAVVESTGPRPAPPVSVPLPEGEAFDIAGAITRHGRSAEMADGADYFECEGDCTGQGVGMTMDGSPVPMPGDEFGAAERRDGKSAINALPLDRTQADVDPPR